MVYLVMAISVKYLPNYTYDDYIQWEGRWEIIEGIAYAMSPMASPRHQRIASRLNTILSNAISQNDNCSCTVYHPIDLKIKENTIVNPDLLIVCKPITGQFLEFPPELVVEILLPSTELKDRHTKFDLYENFGIRHYLIVDPKSNAVEVYTLDEQSRYMKSNIQRISLSLTPTCDIEVSFDTIWD